MLFNSFEFVFFLPIVFLFYWFLTPSGKNGPRYSIFTYCHIGDHTALSIQNAFVLIASYVFYGWWDWRFLLLIAFTSFCSWGSGLFIGRACTKNKAKFWMVLNIVTNLGILAVFKYHNFFVSEFGKLFGICTDGLLLKIVLPVGISFYTFQALSYSIDVYCQKIEPTKDIIAFFAYISFFPQLVAGPIERATNLLPQFLHKRTFDNEQATDGMRQMLWGLFKKIVVADNCAAYVDQVWATYDIQSGSTLLLAAILFTFQIYCDFSGYSDVAIGVAKLFGIKLMRNFNNPYFSRDIAEFWRRWHISLTTWFRDYVYIPLGGSRPAIPSHIANPDSYKKWIIVRNTLVIFLLSGFWHGANWTFIAWGAYHAMLFLPLILLGKNRKYTNLVAEGCLLPSLKESGQMALTFALVMFGWIVFRADTITQACGYIGGIFNHSLLSPPWIESAKTFLPIPIALSFLIMFEWFNRNKCHGMDIRSLCTPARWVVYAVLCLMILAFGAQPETFIYFQF